MAKAGQKWLEIANYALSIQISFAVFRRGGLGTRGVGGPQNHTGAFSSSVSGWAQNFTFVCRGRKVEMLYIYIYTMLSLWYECHGSQLTHSMTDIYLAVPIRQISAGLPYKLQLLGGQV